MSRQMKHFADFFMQGMQIGSGWAEKWQAGQIAKARNDIMKERNAAVDKRENAKLGLYGEQVRANAELAKARAFRALNPVAKGGGGGGAPSSADAEALRREAAERGIISAPPAAPPAAPNITINQSNDGSDGATTDAAAPVEGGYGDDGMAKGGMVRPKRYAEGGIVGGMTLEQAMAYAPRDGGGGGGGRPAPAADPFSSALGKAAGSYKAPEETKTDVRPTGPAGSGAGGSYTTADVPALTAGAGLYRGGGPVRKFQSGGRVMEAIDTGTSGPGSGYGYRAAPPGRSY